MHNIFLQSNYSLFSAARPNDVVYAKHSCGRNRDDDQN